MSAGRPYALFSSYSGDIYNSVPILVRATFLWPWKLLAVAKSPSFAIKFIYPILNGLYDLVAYSSPLTSKISTFNGLMSLCIWLFLWINAKPRHIYAASLTRRSLIYGSEFWLSWRFWLRKWRVPICVRISFILLTFSELKHNAYPAIVIFEFVDEIYYKCIVVLLFKQSLLSLSIVDRAVFEVLWLKQTWLLIFCPYEYFQSKLYLNSSMNSSSGGNIYTCLDFE